MKYILITALTISLFACKTDKKDNMDNDSTHSEINNNDENHGVNTDEVWENLFDGTSMEQWRGYLMDDMAAGWSIEDETLFFNPEVAADVEGSKNIISKKEFGSFELHVEWKISPGGNSGIFWGVLEDEKYPEPYLTGPEIQVLDDVAHPDSFQGGGMHKAGALYDFAPPIDTTAVKPAGEWNVCEIKIDHKANLGQAWLNGIKTAEFVLSGPEFEAAKAKTKFADWEGFRHNNPGHLSLQDHGDKVWYRNIKIREL